VSIKVCPRIPREIFIILLLAVSAGLGGCSDARERDKQALAADKASLGELARIEQVLASGMPLQPSDYESLKKIREKFPRATKVKDTYTSALIKREDWQALIDLFGSEPEGSLSANDKANLARAYFRLGRFADVVTSAEPLVAADPENIDLAALLAGGYYNTGRFDEADALLAKFWPRIEGERRVSEMTLRALVFSRQGKDEESRVLLERVIVLQPENVTALNALSRSHFAKGDVARAEELRKRTEDAQAKITSEENRALRKVQLIYELQDKWNQQQYPDVIVIARQALEVSDAQTKPVLYQYIAESYTRLGRTEEAKAAVEEMNRLK